jgi:hypothetical protein
MIRFSLLLFRVAQCHYSRIITASVYYMLQNSNLNLQADVTCKYSQKVYLSDTVQRYLNNCSSNFDVLC